MMNVPEAVIPLIEALREITSIQAVVLGGSRARGTHLSGSDVDLGLYYDPSLPLDIPALDQLVSRYDDRRQPGLVTSIGGWGPHINGGGWLKIDGIPVDLIYRDLGMVQKAISDCTAGRLEVYDQPGHPFGFLNSIYAAEIVLCLPLWERQRQLVEMKSRMEKYPPMLKKAMVQKFNWEVHFSLEIAEKAAARQDLAYIAGSLFRSVECMCLVLFALNEQHWMNEKGAVAIASSLPIAPADYQGRVDSLFIAIGKGNIHEAISTANQLCSEVNALAEVKPV